MIVEFTFGKSTDAFQYYLGNSILIGLPLTYRIVLICVRDKFAYSDN